MRQKPCPFCGQTEFLSHDYSAPKGTQGLENWKIYCDAMLGGCGASSGSARTKEAAWRTWNRRQAFGKLDRALAATCGTMVVQRVPTEEGSESYEAFVRGDPNRITGRADHLDDVILALSEELP